MFDFNNMEASEGYGFLGFVKLEDLFVNSSIIPDIKLVYMILYDDPKAPEFLITDTGGHFKGKNPFLLLKLSIF